MRNTYKNSIKKIPTKHTVLLIVLFAVYILPCHAKDNVHYKEYRYRIERNSGKSVQQNSTPVALPEKKAGIVLESRNVNIRNGMGSGGWRREKHIILAAPNDRDLESAYINSPRAWYSDEYLVTVMKTSDDRWYWWENDGSLHFYVILQR